MQNIVDKVSSMLKKGWFMSFETGFIKMNGFWFFNMISKSECDLSLSSDKQFFSTRLILYCSNGS